MAQDCALKSTRADVERLLGPAEQPYGVEYELKDGILSIEYSTGPCRKKTGAVVGMFQKVSLSASALRQSTSNAKPISSLIERNFGRSLTLTPGHLLHQ